MRRGALLGIELNTRRRGACMLEKIRHKNTDLNPNRITDSLRDIKRLK